MSFTTGAFKTIFWTRVAGAAFRNDSPKAQAKREIRFDEYVAQVKEEKRKILAGETGSSRVVSEKRQKMADSFVNRNNHKVAVGSMRGYGARI